MKPASVGKVAVGHPVDVASGTLFHDFEDYVVQGRMPLVFARHYSTRLLKRAGGMFGPGWSSPFEMRIRQDLDGYRLIAEDGETEIEFDDPTGVLESGGSVRNLGAFHELRRDRDRLIVTRWDPDGQEVTCYIFPVGPDGQWWLLASCQDVSGQGIDVERDGAGRIRALRQRREKRGYRLVYNRDGRVVEVHLTTPGAHPSSPPRERLVLRYSYDSDGLTDCLDALNNHSSYAYDSTGRMKREVNVGGMTYLFRFDEQGRCVQTTGHDSYGLTTLVFDEVGRMTRVADGQDHVTTYYWNAQGQVEKEVSPLGNVTATTYDEHGRIIQIVKPGGVTTAYEYDGRGDRVKVTEPTGAVTVYQFNEHHQIINVTDPAGFQWSRSFDPAGRIAGVANPQGGTLSYTFNGRGDLTLIEDAAGNKCRFEHDEFGNSTLATDWLGNGTRYEYDEEGRAVAKIDSLGRRTEATLDALGRIREIRLPDQARRRYGWGSFGLLAEYVDELGGVSRWRYTACGTLTEFVRPNGARLQFEWSTIPGQLQGIRNEKDERYRYEYDADGRVIRETDFAGRTARYQYDAAGRVALIERAGGLRTELKHNPAGTVTEVRGADGSTTIYEHDIRGLLVKADNGVCPVERRYDEIGRLVQEKQGEHQIEGEFDVLGNRVRRRSSLGHETSFAWDANGQVVRLAPAGLDPIHFEYDARRNETARFVRGVRIEQSIDSRDRCVKQQTVLADGSWGRPVGSGTYRPHRRYTYDAAGNLVGIADDNWGNSQYTYDSVRRITTARLPNDLTERFDYDAADNLTLLQRERKAGAGTREMKHCQYNPGNELVQRAGTTYEHDALGRLVRKSTTAGDVIYTWDGHGQLARVRLPNGGEWTYRYDPLGRRVQARGSSSCTDFVWDEDVILHELRSSGDGEPEVVHWEFDPSGFAPIAKTQRGIQYLCVNDIAGVPRELVARDGTVAWAAVFSTFGELQAIQCDDVDCPIRYQGQWHDAETGLHYNRFRYYDPAVGRYISPDPIGLVGGLNVYQYAQNTLRWIDPYGLSNKPACKGKIYRQLSADDRAALDRGERIQPAGTGARGADNIVRQVKGEPTGLISASQTAAGTERFDSGHGLAEIDVAQLQATGSTVVDHGNVMQAVQRGGSALDVDNARTAQEVMIKGGIDPSAVTIINE